MWYAILVRDVFSITQVKRDDEGQFLQVEVDIDGQKLRFVSLYAPIRNPARNTFFASVPDFVDLAYPTFVCGDFNAVLDPDLDRKRRSSYAGPSQRSASSELQLFTLCEQQPKRFLFGIPGILQMSFIRGIMPQGNFPTAST
jgi:hypothetical protein